MTGQYSIENVFNTIEKAINEAGSFEVVNKQMPVYSRGLKNRWAIIKYARDNQGDINHIVGDISFASYLLKKKKTIITIHDLGSVKVSKLLRKMFLLLFWVLLPATRCRYITVISSNTKKDLIKQSFGLIPANKIIVIPNPITLGFKKYNQAFNAEKPRLLQLGTGINKNVERLIQSIKGISCTLVIVGLKKSHILNLLDQHNIDYEWYKDLSNEEVYTEYKKADIVTVVSTFEGFGLPILEAQAVGRAVIAGKNSSMIEVAGEGALLVDAENEEEIRKGIIKIIHDSAFRLFLVKRGFENVERFHGDRIAKMYIDLYQKLNN